MSTCINDDDDNDENDDESLMMMMMDLDFIVHSFHNSRDIN